MNNNGELLWNTILAGKTMVKSDNIIQDKSWIIMQNYDEIKF